MRSNLRYVITMIRQGGGDQIAVRQGGRHTHVEFIAPDGKGQFVTIHRGSNPTRYEDSLRSQLRRKGLNP